MIEKIFISRKNTGLHVFFYGFIGPKVENMLRLVINWVRSTFASKKGGKVFWSFGKFKLT